ncbi:MAG: 2Fe-2S iron-sulfur cluster binding domain-containing protein, partial [Gammaproteobacteria bacterium]|nr:2Fe-2S iron-sulfur cluster binding domain-containing protein [Gammaproteobacteria bacterium]
THEVEVATGYTVMDGAFKNGIEGIEAECGGACACATCHCYVDPEWTATFKPAKPDELEMLEFAKSEYMSNSRLACQLTITDAHDGLIVHLPELQ